MNDTFQTFAARIEQTGETIKSAETLEEKETLRMQTYPPTVVEASGQEIPITEGKKPLEQVSEYLQGRADTQNDVYSWPSEKAYPASVEDASPFMVVVSPDALADSFPKRIAGVKLVLLQAGAPVPF